MLIVTASLVAVSVSDYRISFDLRKKHRKNDIDLYFAEAVAVHDGAGYYETAYRELTNRGYPTRSVFNWRTPLPMWLVSQLPDPQTGRWLIGLPAIALVLCGAWLVRREGAFGEALIAGTLLGGTAIPVFSGVQFVMPVLWGGVLIGLSLCCFGLKSPASADVQTNRLPLSNRWSSRESRFTYLAVGCGIAAAFFRDLAVGYCLLMLLYAAANRRWREVLAWTAGLAVYAAFFAWHATRVADYLTADGGVHGGDWIQAGGAAFLIACAHVSGFLLVLPQWCAAIFLAFAVFGLIGWKSETGFRALLTAGGYLAVFSIVGKDVNQYWGALVAPLLVMGFAKSPTAFIDLWNAVRGVG